MRLHTIMAWLLAAYLAFTLTACASTRYSCTIKPSGDKNLRMGDIRFSLEPGTGRTGEENPIAVRARELYPNLFTDDWTGLPVMVSSNVKREEPLGFLPLVWGVCTVALAPIPDAKNFTYTLETRLINSSGDIIPVGTGTYEFSEVMWFCLTPLGLIPVIGPSDLPRKYETAFTDRNTDSYRKAYKEKRDFLAGCEVETIVKSLRASDQAKLAADYEARKKRVQQIVIDGRQCWSFLTPSFSPGQGRADCFSVLIYQDYPKRGARPLDDVVVARRDAGGSWRPVSGYLRSARIPTTVGVLMENGMPARVVVRAVEEPPLEDFIDLPDASRNGYAADLQWSNGILLEIKNRSLAKTLEQKSGEELIALATRIEKAILVLSTESERAKDRAQAAVEQGGNPGPDREMAVLYRQRIEILKPVLAAIKQAASTKKP